MDGCKADCHELHLMLARVISAERRLEKLREALAFYAAGEHIYVIPCDCEYGTRAKEALDSDDQIV